MHFQYDGHLSSRLGVSLNRISHSTTPSTPNSKPYRASISLVDLVEGKPKMVTAKLRAYDESGKEADEDMGDITMVLTFKTGAGQFDARALR